MRREISVIAGQDGLTEFCGLELTRIRTRLGCLSSGSELEVSALALRFYSRPAEAEAADGVSHLKAKRKTRTNA